MVFLLLVVASAAPDGGLADAVDPPLSRCHFSQDCGWVAGRCVKPPPDAGAEVSDSCVCIDEWCSARPEARGPTGSCTAHADCRVDLSAGQCVVAPQPGFRFPLREQGPTCACRAGACQLEWIDPVACTSWRDCSFSREPVLHPTSSKKVKRERPGPVRPCRDAERDAVCDPVTKTCRVVAWSC